jgi:hypothetical protein
MGIEVVVPAIVMIIALILVLNHDRRTGRK